ncbi:MAG TPA: glycosyltransferase family 4 protein, partial [Gemmatimonadaceae bacterium]|nr:glycosyltransferase family 4 protein [Gemmatimonadaceae bacterium]
RGVPRVAPVRAGRSVRRSGSSHAVARPRILVVLDYYLPGVNAGGPVRSVANLALHLAGEADFLVITRDRDFGDARPYAGVTRDRWVSVEGAQVRYMSRRWPGSITRLVRRTPHDALYLCSYFSPSSLELLWARHAGLVRSDRFVIAPRGQFAEAALANKARKKAVTLRLANATGVHRHVMWHAANDAEASRIRAVVRPEGRVITAANLPSPSSAATRTRRKMPGRLRVVTVARVHPMKNILESVRLLRDLDGEIEYDVIGPHEDARYLAECREAAAALPSRVSVRFPGAMSHASLVSVLPEYDLFLLPSRTESFGHSILEALSHGVPVLVSDRTPWRGLERHGAGWDVPLDDAARFRQALVACVAMDDAAFRARADAARRVAREASESTIPQTLDAYRELFLLP